MSRIDGGRNNVPVGVTMNEVSRMLWRQRGNRVVVLTQYAVPEAMDRMVIDHPDGLHERVTNRRTDKREPPAFEILTHGHGDRGEAGHVLWRFPAIADRPAFDHVPQVRIKASEGLLYGQKGPRIGNGRLNFKAIPDDAGVAQQLPHLAGVISGDGRRVKVIKGFTECGTFLQDRVPA